MPKQALTIKMKITGVKEILSALRDMPKDAQNEIRDGSVRLAEKLAGKARSSSTTTGSPQGILLASTVKAVRDRVPVIQAGGTKRVGRNDKPAWKILFGVEFGSLDYIQFQKLHSSEGYWLFPLVRRENDTIEREYHQIVDAVARKWAV